VNRLPALQDLSAHQASADHTLPENSTSTGEVFRDGMEGDERECELFIYMFVHPVTVCLPWHLLKPASN